jgi:hypothetical protein
VTTQHAERRAMLKWIRTHLEPAGLRVRRDGWPATRAAAARWDAFLCGASLSLHSERARQVVKQLRLPSA